MDNKQLQTDDWKKTDIQSFWGEIAACDHLVQIYDNDQVFLNTLEGFAGCGLLSGDSVVVIATKEHLLELNDRLTKQNFNLAELISEDRYFPLEAAELLSRFMVNNWPAELLFEECVSQVISRATKGNRKVRAFGEMVALLWQQGNSGATITLEHLWCKFLRKNSFTLYCAYPKNGFSECAGNSVDSICKTHSKIIDGQARPATEVYYREIG